MSSNFNQITLIGNVTADPVLKTVKDDLVVCNFSLAVNTPQNKKDDAKEAKVNYFRCALFGKGAETLAKYVKKGSPLFVTGRVDVDPYVDKEGVKHNSFQVYVDRFQFLGGNKPNGASAEAPASNEEADDEIPF